MYLWSFYATPRIFFLCARKCIWIEKKAYVFSSNLLVFQLSVLYSYSFILEYIPFGLSIFNIPKCKNGESVFTHLFESYTTRSDVFSLKIFNHFYVWQVLIRSLRSLFVIGTEEICNGDKNGSSHKLSANIFVFVYIWFRWNI